MTNPIALVKALDSSTPKGTAPNNLNTRRERRKQQRDQLKSTKGSKK